MPVLERSLRYLFAPIVLTFIGIAALQQLTATWQEWLPSFHELPYYLLALSTLLALQFNCGRISYLSLLLLLYYYLRQVAPLAALDQDQVFLAGTLIITFFAISKDRSPFSIHFFKVLLGISLCFALAFVWKASASGLASFNITQLPSMLNLVASLYIPVGISCIVISIYTVLHASGTNSTIALTQFIWLFHHYLPKEMPLAILLSMLATAYLFSMLFALYDLAYKDELTGLSSRRALNTMALSLNNHYSLAMIDIDHFKKFNDTYGHDVGDQVLRLVAKKLSKVKGGGQVFRYGGEEFTIVFENKNIERVLPHLEELRHKISHYDIVLREQGRKSRSKLDRNSKHKANQALNITISIGVAEQHGETTFEKTLKRADEALYKAKNNGRNCVFA
ncbi:diguanylate cyclase [Shewanella halifaxensis HAW-EB4]|uniref:diguanylate cyclase n=1 Tax=Shewanella halifaxensis (strain HAW-EB4) TaxID=458817 RepID=B0TNU9_SHEHH|nr:GGDEF domain-containing protein [Shewanella halifaxensis]ABZ74852.1 diguanylate cyclase [Shewanella halifaxensis HAW-EB4]